MKPLCKVLIVEDDVFVRQLLADVFHSEGYAFVLVGNADEMRSALEREPVIDVIVIDVNLPGRSNGIALAREVAAEGYGVILVTGDHDRFEEMVQSGHRYLLKPFRLASLLELVDDVLEETAADCRRTHAGGSAHP